MKKPTICCCFTRIVFLKLNLIVALLSIRKTWMIDLPVRWGGWGVLRNRGGGGDPSNGVNDFEMEGLIPLYGLHWIRNNPL